MPFCVTRLLINSAGARSECSGWGQSWNWNWGLGSTVVECLLVAAQQVVIKRAFVGIVAFAHTAGWAIFLAEVLFVMGKLLVNSSSAMAVLPSYAAT
jgi:hypothetical protein